MSAAEFALWAVMGLVFWTKKLHNRFPAMAVYLILRVVSTPVLLCLLYALSQPGGQTYFPVYFFGYWAVYLASAVIVFFICMEIFRSSLSGFPGLLKFGLVIFRWAVLASVIVTLSTLSFAHRGFLIISDLADGLMRSVSVLELCLLAFLCLSMNALRISIRDVAFGFALGLGMMSATDFVVVSLISHNTSLAAPLQMVYEALILFTVGLWVVYCALPEPARKPMMMPANSTIYRWNEIATALGHTGTQVALQQPANSFFLTDVEMVVEKVLTRNMKGRESES
jgi:hypothetical protein